MKRATLVLFATATALVGTAIAQEATLPEVKARKEQMQAQRAAVAVLGGMAQGQTAFDAAAATAAKTELAASAAMIPAKFEAQVTEAASKARPEIWTNWADYVSKAEALEMAAEALDTTSLDGLRAGLGAVGAACQACHEAYRM
jgi:cytochrome c556